MKKRSTLFYHILIFVLAQIAWFFLLGLWIYWYVSNYIILTKVGESTSAQLINESPNVFALVSGLILLVFISVGMSLIFIYLNRQMNITKLYDTIIANVTHELKSPLSSIQIYLETMSSRNVPYEKRDEFINFMLNDISRLNNLINSILYISGLEQKKTALKYPHDYQVFSADEVYRLLIDEAKIQFKLDKKNVSITGRTENSFVVDKTWLKIVIDNLFDNAVKYSLDNPQIHIKLYNTEKYIVLDFIDQGIGISKTDQKIIFNKFERLYNAEIPSVKGTGLGLYWVRQIINYHGGRVSVYSAGKNKGSKFTIELPIYQASRKRYLKNLLEISRKRKEIKENNNE